MANWELKIIAAEVRRLIALAAEDAELRRDLRALAEEVLAATEAVVPPAEPASDAPASGSGPGHSSSDATQSPITERPGSHDALQSETAGDDRVPGKEPLRELTLGRRVPQPFPAWHSLDVSTSQTLNDELDQIEARCRSKAEAARWAAERQRRILEGYEVQVEDAPSDPEMVEWANRLTDGFYWASLTAASQPADLSLLDDVGGCFETVAEALALAADGEGNLGASQRALPLLAEAQSALRQALARLRLADDPDQLAIFEWVRASAARQRVFLKRFMRADDLADPLHWPDLRERVDKEEARHGRSGKQSAYESAIARLRPLVELIKNGRGTEGDWQTIADAMEAMVNQEMAPSNREARELLLPVLDDLVDRDDWPRGFRLVLREIDRFLANHSTPARASTSHEATAKVSEVARLLGGRKAALIGGSRRREAQESLRKAFGLNDLIWVETKEHQAVGSFEHLIARADVALVLLAIRWSSHAFGDVKQICDRHGKPLVRLPAGYNPNQVATQILRQCHQHLRNA